MARLTWDTDLEMRFETLGSPRLNDATQAVLDLVSSLESSCDIGRLMQLVRA